CLFFLFCVFTLLCCPSSFLHSMCVRELSVRYGVRWTSMWQMRQRLLQLPHMHVLHVDVFELRGQLLQLPWVLQLGWGVSMPSWVCCSTLFVLPAALFCLPLFL